MGLGKISDLIGIPALKLPPAHSTELHSPSLLEPSRIIIYSECAVYLPFVAAVLLVFAVCLGDVDAVDG